MELQLFKYATNVDTFPAGAIVFEQGELGSHMYVVRSGEVDIVLGNQLIETVGPGGMIGEMALLSDEPRSATVLARTECALVPIDKRRFTIMVQQHPYFALQVMQVLASRLRSHLQMAG